MLKAFAAVAVGAVSFPLIIMFFAAAGPAPRRAPMHA